MENKGREGKLNKVCTVKSASLQIYVRYKTSIKTVFLF